jgi:hypothetical protein
MEGYHAYSFKTGKDLTPTYRNLPFLCVVIYILILRFMITFASCFAKGNAHRWGEFPKSTSGIAYHLVPGLLF